jgi:hypothetical protein
VGALGVGVLLGRFFVLKAVFAPGFARGR